MIVCNCTELKEGVSGDLKNTLFDGCFVFSAVEIVCHMKAIGGIDDLFKHFIESHQSKTGFAQKDKGNQSLDGTDIGERTAA